MRLVPWQPDDLLRRLDDVVSVYGEAVGFRSVATLTTDGRLAGFGYGYTSGPGQWWHDQVRSALDERSRAMWLSDCFEVVELHVRPTAQGHGVGARQLRALLAMADRKTALLSTPEADEQKSRAWRLYRRFRFVDVLRDFVFPGDERAFAILGRELPLAERRPVDAP